MSGIITFPSEGRLSGSEIEKIAAELHRLQTDHSESLTQIAERADVAPSTVAALANPAGARGSNPRASTLKKIKEAYPSFMEDRRYVELAITGHCYFGKVNPPRAMEPSSVALRPSGMIDFDRMAAVVIKKTQAPCAQGIFEGAYFIHPKSFEDAVPPEEALGKFCVVYERQDDEVAAGAIWLGTLAQRPGSPEDWILVSMAGDGERPNTPDDPVILAPKAARSLNIEYVQLVYSIMLQAQIDAFREREAAISDG